MTTSYPGALDALTNPTGTDPLTSPSHAAQHANANDAIEALETYPGRGILGYTAYTAGGQTGITTETDLTGATVTVTVAASRRIRISCWLRLYPGADNDNLRLSIKESTTELAGWYFTLPLAGTNGVQTCFAEAIVSPSAGSHTYKLTGTKVVGTSFNTSVGASVPLVIMVEDIGAA